MTVTIAIFTVTETESGINKTDNIPEQLASSPDHSPFPWHLRDVDPFRLYPKLHEKFLTLSYLRLFPCILPCCGFSSSGHLTTEKDYA